MNIVIFSVIIWWAIDQVKRIYIPFHIPKNAQKIITICLAVAAGAIFAWCFKLDLLVTLGVVENVTAAGHVLAAIGIAAGSSAVHELTQKINVESLEFDPEELYGEDDSTKYDSEYREQDREEEDEDA